jgi:hypothetical protein
MTESTASAPCCGNCRYSVVNQVEHRLTCNRYAPKAESCYGTGPRDTVGDFWAYWPSVSSGDWCGEWAPLPDDGPGPSITPEAIARFLAHSDSIPALDGMTVLPSQEEHPAPAEPEFLTYDQPFEDPLQ